MSFMNSVTILSPGEYDQLTGPERDAYCQALEAEQVWKQPGYNAREDDCIQYGYVPSLRLGATFLALFVTLTLIHTVLTIGWRKYWNRYWTMLTIVAGGILEIVGWIGRVLAHSSPYNYNYFICQITTLIIAPVFFSAALYFLLGFVIIEVGSQYSVLKPKSYAAIFITCDFVSLVLQGAGGGIAGTANTSKQANRGANIMEGGIVFQLVTTIVFSILALDFCRKAKRAGKLPTRYSRLYYLGSAIAIGTAMILVRGIYRTVELAQGWHGYLIENELWFLCDAIPMVILLVPLAAAHPFWTLPRRDPTITIIEEGKLEKESS